MPHKHTLSDNAADGEEGVTLVPASRPIGCVFVRYPGVAPLVFKHLPEPGEPPISAAEIHRRIDIGAPLTVRAILGQMRRHGIVASTLVPRHGDLVRRLYTKAPDADDYETAKLVYGDGER